MQEMREMPVWFLGREDPLEEGMVTHSKAIHSCLENPKDRGAWQAAVHRVSKSRTRLKRLSAHNPVSVKALCVLKSSYSIILKFLLSLMRNPWKAPWLFAYFQLYWRNLNGTQRKYELRVNEVNVSKGFNNMQKNEDAVHIIFNGCQLKIVAAKSY